VVLVYSVYRHTHKHNELFSKLSVGLGLGIHVYFVRLFRFRIVCVFWFSLDYVVLSLFAFVVVGLVSSVSHEERDERLRNDQFSTEWT